MLKRARLLLSTALIGSALLANAPAQAQGVAGAYLAATQATYRGDYDSAAHYFIEAVRRDMDNPFLLQNTVVNGVVANRFDDVVPYAQHMTTLDTETQIAGLVLVADAIAREDFDAATAYLGEEKFRFNPLILNLLKGWSAAGQGKMGEAVAHLDGLSGDESGFGPLAQYHKALIMAVAGNFDGAAEIFAGDDGEALRVSRASLISHIQVLAQLGNIEEAIALIDSATPNPDAELIDLKSALEAGEYVPFDQLSSAKDGAAEVFLTLATALSREQAEVFALLYARLAQKIRPDYIEAYLLSADIFEEQGQYDLAVADYNVIPEDSGVFRDAELGRASALSQSGDNETAITVMQALSEKFPEDAFILISLGDAFRRDERYREGAETYSRAIEMSGEERPGDWRNYYVRAICYERLDEWDAAEADFRKALELQADQPLVLNYLGYSLVEKNMKIDEARDMIERAVAGDPDNGYITDSLGWVLYKIGKYEEAVPHMERAVELLPSDPVINDHLGDVLWMVGRKTEAVFQWKRALSFEPGVDSDPDRIRRKLEVGLDVVLEEEAAQDAN